VLPFEGVGWTLLNGLQALFLAVWTVFWISAALVCSLVSSSFPLVLARHCWAPGLAWASIARLELAPGPALDPKQPYVLVMNHTSMFDIVTAFALVPVNIRFVAKKVLKYVPFLGWYMWRTGMVFVDRKNRAQAVASLQAAGAQIRAGATVLAYAEGTRSADGTIMPFKKGPFVLAIQAQVPVVPIAIVGAHAVLPPGGFRLRPGQVRLSLGAPIPTAGLVDADVEPLMQRVRDSLIDQHVAIGGPGGDKRNAIALPGLQGVGRQSTTPPPPDLTA
jgi:1-acyl-sn-glycerol-3-phosphate acyltransferase